MMTESLRIIPYFLVAISLILFVACGDQPSSIRPTVVAPDTFALQQKTFERISQIIDDEYVYEGSDGAGWSQIQAQYSPSLKQNLSMTEFDVLLKEMLAELPEDTAFLETRLERINLLIETQDSSGGIGAFIGLYEEPESRIALLDIMPDSPAEAAGLKAHDAVIAIDGKPVSLDYTGLDVGRVRGVAGADVLLTVRSPDGREREVNVTRDDVQQSVGRLEWTMLPENNIGYFLFPPASYEELERDFLLGLQALAFSEAEGLILDLRIVSMGDNWPASSMLSLFFDGGAGAFYSPGESRAVEVEGISSIAGSQEMPLVLLVGPDTSGAAEIFAAILQSADRAMVLGMDTPGHVESISSFPLPNGSTLFLATTSYKTNEGRDIGLSGVHPDEVIEVYWDEVSPEKDIVLDSAQQLLLQGLG